MGEEIVAKVGQIEGRIGVLDSKVGQLGAEIRGYHSAVVGHGIAITELEEQVGRLGDHAGLPWRRAS